MVKYVSLWSNNEINSFKTDPHNAVLTWGDGLEKVEVVITDADFDGNNITHTIENSNIIANQIFEDVSQFVDCVCSDLCMLGLH